MTKFCDQVEDLPFKFYAMQGATSLEASKVC